MTTSGLQILLVEDNPGDARLVREMLSDAGLAVSGLKVAERLSDALTELNAAPFDIILLDLTLPDSSGLETVRQVLEHIQSTPIVVMTGNMDESQAIEAVKIGAQDYLRKDALSSMLLNHAIRYAIERQRMLGDLLDSEQRYRGLFEGESDAILVFDAKTLTLEDFNQAALDLIGCTRETLINQRASRLACLPDEIEETLQRVISSTKEQHIQIPQLSLRQMGSSPIPVEFSVGHYSQGGVKKITMAMRDISDRIKVEAERKHHMEQQQETLVQTIELMAMTIEKRDPFTSGHQKRVAKLASAIATEMQLPQDEIDGIYLSGLIHDIGKIYVPAEILSRPGKLCAEEMALVKAHSQIGYDIVKGVSFPWPVADMILQHQERCDGSGYPQGLKGSEMLLGSRILAVSDVIEAMVSHRPYRPALGLEAAIMELEQQRGILFDSDVVEAVIRLFREKGYCLD